MHSIYGWLTHASETPYIDGHGMYSKQPKAFRERLISIDLKEFEDWRKQPFKGIELLGDREPSKNKNREDR